MDEIERYIRTLPEEEQERYKDLIEEHRRIDGVLADSFSEARENLTRFYGAADRMCKSIQEVQEAYTALQDEVYTLALHMLEGPSGRYH